MIEATRGTEGQLFNHYAAKPGKSFVWKLKWYIMHSNLRNPHPDLKGEAKKRGCRYFFYFIILLKMSESDT